LGYNLKTTWYVKGGWFWNLIVNIVMSLLDDGYRCWVNMVWRLKLCIAYVVVTHATSIDWHRSLPLGCNHQQEGCHCYDLWVTRITNWVEGHTWWLCGYENNGCFHTIQSNHICWDNKRSNNSRIKGFCSHLVKEVP